MLRYLSILIVVFGSLSAARAEVSCSWQLEVQDYLTQKSTTYRAFDKLITIEEPYFTCKVPVIQKNTFQGRPVETLMAVCNYKKPSKSNQFATSAMLTADKPGWTMVPLYLYVDDSKPKTHLVQLLGRCE